MMVGGVALGGLGVRQILSDAQSPQIPVIYDWNNEVLGQSPAVEQENFNANENVYVPDGTTADSGSTDVEAATEDGAVNEEGAGEIDE